MEHFTKWMGKGEKHSEVPPEIIEKFKGIFLIGEDSYDIVVSIWENHGLSSYKNGLFSIVNPIDYQDIIRKFPNASNSAIVFAKSCVGGLFVFERLNIGDSILYYNVHYGNRKVISTSFEIFFEWEIGADNFWKEECYGKIELKVNQKLDAPAYDECYAFFPALALGGNENISNMEKVKVIEHLNFLAQLY